MDASACAASGALNAALHWLREDLFRGASDGCRRYSGEFVSPVR